MNKFFAIFVMLVLGLASGYSQSMEWICHPGEYSQIQYMGGDLFKVKSMQERWGLIHANGNMLIEAIYDSITPFVENRALLLDKEGRRLLGIVDTNGKMVRNFSNDEIYVSRYPNYKEGLLPFGGKDGLFGYMNENGMVVINPQFYLAAPFQKGIAAVQYANTDYGLINRSGRSVIVSNEHYPFISSPIDGKVLALRGSRKGGDQLVIMRLDGPALKKENVLEDGMNIWLSDDFSSIHCQLGHTYYIDNQWRVAGSSHNAKLPAFPEDSSHLISETSTVLSKLASEDGMIITYLGNPIMDLPFDDVATYDKAYAIVRSRTGNTGVLRLNPSASIKIKNLDNPMIFNHNMLKDAILDVDLVDVDPSKIKWYRNDKGWLTHSTLEQVDGKWKLRMPYFKASDSYDDEVTDTVDIAITYDGLDWIHQYVEVKSLHKPGYDVTIMGNDITAVNGTATLTLSVTANGNADAKGTISINGNTPVDFSDGGKSLPLNVSVPEGSDRTFTFIVEVNEDGCPPFTTQVTKKVKNPIRESDIDKKSNNRKNSTEKEKEKKKIIIQ